MKLAKNKSAPGPNRAGGTLFNWLTPAQTIEHVVLHQALTTSGYETAAIMTARLMASSEVAT